MRIIFNKQYNLVITQLKLRRVDASVALKRVDELVQLDAELCEGGGGLFVQFGRQGVFTSHNPSEFDRDASE